VPAAILEEIDRLQPTRLVLLGGTAVLTTRLARSRRARPRHRSSPPGSRCPGMWPSSTAARRTSPSARVAGSSCAERTAARPSRTRSPSTTVARAACSGWPRHRPSRPTACSTRS
jgi:hypothetical protein